MHYDAIVIGAGQAGPPMADRLAREGRSVALIERKHPGGTCVNTGCIPTKTLVASARVAHVARRAADFGVNVGGPVTVDMAKVKARKDEVALGSRAMLTQWIESIEGLTLIRGHARFEANRQIRVDDQVLTADQIFINVGARPRKPDFPLAQGVWTNSDLMEVDFLPPHLVVIGGGYIGLEFAQMYRRFGSEVTVIDRGERLLRREDPEVGEVIADFLQREGITLRLEAECINVEGEPGAFHAGVVCAKDSSPIQASHCLAAVGRVPNTHDLGLETTDIALDDRGFIRVDDGLRTSVEGIWALGEVNGRGAFTHTTWNDFEIVSENMFDDARRLVTDRHSIYGLFVDPPLGRVGMNDQQARASGKRVLKGYRPMRRVGRAKEKSETDGFMSILVDADTDKILGATILGTQGDEAIHAVADLMYAGASYETLRRAVHIHPTVAELLPTIAGGLKPLE